VKEEVILIGVEGVLMLEYFLRYSDTKIGT